MKILIAPKQIEFGLKLLAAAGFTSFASAFEAKDENALKTHIEQLVAKAPAKTVEKVVEKITEPTDEQITALVSAELREQITGAGLTLAAGADPITALKDGLAAHATLKAEVLAYTTGLAAAGIKFAASDEKVGLTAADITSAINNRVSIKAGELSAAIGTRPLETKLTNTPGAGGKTEGLTGLAKTAAAYGTKYDNL